MIYKHIEVKENKRCFLVTDIHGEYDFLISSLKQVGYDETKDILISLGDLIDRGTNSLKCLQMFLFDKTGLKHSLIGNHCKMLVDKDFDLHLYNVGSWILSDLPNYEDRYWLGDYIQEKFNYVMSVKLGESYFGLTHACVPIEFERFNDFVMHLQQSWPNKGLTFETVWQREFIEYKDNKFYSEAFIEDCDYVFHGHNIVPEVTTVANRVHFDLGAAYKGRMCIIELLDKGEYKTNIFSKNKELLDGNLPSSI